MFEDLCDEISFLWGWCWPAIEGEVTAVEVERIRHQRSGDTVRLSVTYKFSVGEDGPYTGEAFWKPTFFQRKRVIAARRKIRVRQPVKVRYRPDDPSINMLDRALWKEL